MSELKACLGQPDFSATPGIPKDEDGVVFAAPWEAKAFALVIQLHQEGRFEWQELVDALSGEIAADASRTPHTPYYELWLAAAEKLVSGKGLLSAEGLHASRVALQSAQHQHDDHDHDHDHHHHHHHHHHH